MAKRRKRATVEDAPMGPKEKRSSVLSQAEKAVFVAFRKRTLQPLDACNCAKRLKTLKEMTVFELI